jgi:perosamine synthetase
MATPPTDRRRGKAALAPDASTPGVVPLAVPSVAGNEWAYVKEALDSNWVSPMGPFLERFEQAIAARVGSPHAVAVSSGTAALHLALLLAGVRADDEVVLPSLSFIAPANAVHYLGARPAFVDVEADYWQLDVDKVAEFLERECRPASGSLVDRRTGRRIGALLPVHVLGHPVDLDPLLELGAHYELPVIEDAAEGLGARYRDRSPGTFGIVGALSFNGNKVITTGGGGMLLTADAALADRARYLATQAKDDPLEYVHGEVGFNYRLSNVLAAIGCAQLEALDAKVEARRRIATRYAQAFADVAGITTMNEAPWAYATHWLSTIRVDESATGFNSRDLLRRLWRRGIQTRPLWQPLHLSRPFADCPAYRCETVLELWAEALSLPSSSDLTLDDQDRVIDAILAEVSG